MLAAQRQDRILKVLRRDGTVRTAQMAKRLKVSDETIRNDFEVLEGAGRLVRIHGGAREPHTVRQELTLRERMARQREEKRVIAQAATTRVREGETIFLDASSTVMTMVEFLPDIPLTILTNALDVVYNLGDRSACDVIAIGGLWDPRSRSTVGLWAEEAIRRYRIHRMFFSGNALDHKRGASEVNARQAVFKERVLALSDETCLLVDHTKLGQRSSFFFAPVEQLTTLITDDGADPAFLGKLKNPGLEIIRA